MILITVHDKDHPQKFTFTNTPVVFGRDQENNVILNDPSVSRKHAEITAGDFGYILRDLNSRNGIYKDGEKVSSLALTGKNTLFLGDTKIDIEVAQVLADTKATKRQVFNDKSPSTRLGAVLRLAYSFTIITALTVLSSYMNQWPLENPLRLYGRAFAYSLAAIIISTILSIPAKMNSKHYYFDKLVFAVTNIATLSYVIWQLAPLLVFNLHVPHLNDIFSLIMMYFIVLLFSVRILLYLMPRWTFKSRLFVSTCIAGLSLFLPLFLTQETTRDGDRTTMTSIGVTIGGQSLIKSSTDDLLFDIALSIAENDQARLKLLGDILEEERDTESP